MQAFTLPDSVVAKVLAHVIWDLSYTQKGKLRIKFLDYSTSKECILQPDIVKYDGKKWVSQGLTSFLVQTP